jgi:hypothetical protein
MIVPGIVVQLPVPSGKAAGRVETAQHTARNLVAERSIVGYLNSSSSISAVRSPHSALLPLP